MPFVKIAIHSVWGTKNRLPVLSDEIREILCKHIFENSKKKGIYIDTINGYTDHLHCLFYLNANMNLSTALNLLKGESSNWMNKQNLIKNKFEWADEYFANSVSESNIPKVREYIQNQKEHHKKITFQEEYNNFLKNYGFIKL